MRLRKDRVGEDRSHCGMRTRAQCRNLLLRQFRWRSRIQRPIPASIAVDQREILQSVDVVWPIGTAEEVVEEGSQPSIAGARVRGEPEDLAHAQSSAGPGLARSRAVVCFSCAATSSITETQSPRIAWRNKRALGYHGESERSRSHRQSGTVGNRIHAGTSSAPAICTVELSIDTTRSIA